MAGTTRCYHYPHYVHHQNSACHCPKKSYSVAQNCSKEDLRFVRLRSMGRKLHYPRKSSQTGPVVTFPMFNLLPAPVPMQVPNGGAIVGCFHQTDPVVPAAAFLLQAFAGQRSWKRLEKLPRSVTESTYASPKFLLFWIILFLSSLFWLRFMSFTASSPLVIDSLRGGSPMSALRPWNIICCCSCLSRGCAFRGS